MKKMINPSVIALIAAIIMLVAIFLPYASARAGFQELIEMLPENECIKGTDITLRSTLRVSMVKFLKIYNSSQEGKAVAEFCFWLVLVMGIAAFFAGVFALLKKSAAMLFSGVIAFAAFYLHNGNYGNRGVVPGAEYRFGIGYYLFASAAIVVIAAGIWMLRDRKKTQAPKQNEKNSQN